ncbi:MAG: polyphenol oxidase family protein [Bacteroidales bacterium]|nr:polyphenol oxidase family protein [Bacteroidales bacterium]
MDTSFIEFFCNRDDIVAGTTCRGSSVDALDRYSGFTLCHYTGDNRQHYVACRNRLASALGLAPEMIIIPRQTHGTSVLTVGDALPSPDELDGMDAVVTSRRGVVIGVNTADCLPLVMADTVSGVIGAVHAGWRGAVAGIQLRAIDAMCGLGARPSRIKVYAGPCICLNCFEVGDEVACRFPDKFVSRRGTCRPHVDLARYVADTLVGAGLSMDNMTLPTACTKCRPDRYFSARAAGIASGRNFTFIYRP